MGALVWDGYLLSCACWRRSPWSTADRSCATRSGPAPLKDKRRRNRPGPDPLQLLAADVDQLKGYALQLKSDLDLLNNAIAAREEKLRRWLLALLVWNIVMTLGLVVLAVFALRR